MTATPYFNHLSIPAETKEEAARLFLDVSKALSRLVNQELCKPGWMSENNIYEYEIAPDYFISNFFVDHREAERDIILFLQRMATWYPFLDKMENELREKFEYVDYKIEVNGNDVAADILGAAYLEDGIAISLNTGAPWGQSELTVKAQPFDEELNPVGESIQVIVLNIYGVENFFQIKQKLEEASRELLPENWENLFPDVHRHPRFIEWFEGQEELVQIKAMKKTKFAHDLGFRCGEPLIKTLQGDEWKKKRIKELRFTVHGNQEVRILFKPLPNGKIGYLLGGFKTGGNKWYDQVKEAAFNRADDCD